MNHGPATLPVGLIAVPFDADHIAPLFSTAAGQTTPNRLVTRRTPVNFAVCCLIDLIQREHAAQLVSFGDGWMNEAEKWRRYLQIHRRRTGPRSFPHLNQEFTLYAVRLNIALQGFAATAGVAAVALSITLTDSQGGSHPATISLAGVDAPSVGAFTTVEQNYAPGEIPDGPFYGTVSTVDADGVVSGAAVGSFGDTVPATPPAPAPAPSDPGANPQWQVYNVGVTLV